MTWLRVATNQKQWSISSLPFCTRFSFRVHFYSLRQKPDAASGLNFAIWANSSGEFETGSTARMVGGPA